MNTRAGVAISIACLSGLLMVASVQGAEPAKIRQVQLMPNLPSPFEIRDWKRVAVDLDQLLFDASAKGQYLPLVHLIRNAQGKVIRFGIPDYVGDFRDPKGDGTAITDIGAVWGATLVGIDKSTGPYDYVKMCEAFFDHRLQMAGNKVGQCDPDKTFWYTLFPNIIFASVAEKYPHETRMSQMARAAAVSWARATTALTDADKSGVPNFDHTGFDFNTMKGVDNGKWKEPDAGAGVAWLEYAAYRRWRDPQFLLAAKRAMSYLDQRPADKNPSYEILMPFGALTAVQMNAELGSHYDTSKMINWCFDLGVARPDWKVNTERWDDVDAAGLVGATDCPPWRSGIGGYGFAMNTFCWPWALAPVARYDPRYAHDIGKWILNAANAARLFYSNYHSPEHQTSADWNGDPKNVIAYEGLKYRWDNPKQPLLATGDPLHEHWGPKTDYGIYGSVFVGVFGAMIARTNVPQILRLDLLATDTFHPPAYPTYLYYNPLKQKQVIDIQIGSAPHDIYDAVTGKFIQRGTTRNAQVAINPDQAIVAVLTPAGGTLTHASGKTYVNNIVIDYRHGNTQPE